MLTRVRIVSRFHRSVPSARSFSSVCSILCTQPQVSPKIGIVESVTVFSVGTIPSIQLFRISMAFLADRSTGLQIVVSPRITDSRRASKPVTARSCGTRIPFSLKHSIILSAMSSLPHMTASGSSPPMAMIFSAAARPPTRVHLPSKIKSSLKASPCFLMTWRQASTRFFATLESSGPLTKAILRAPCSTIRCSVISSTLILSSKRMATAPS